MAPGTLSRVYHARSVTPKSSENPQVKMKTYILQGVQATSLVTHAFVEDFPSASRSEVLRNGARLLREAAGTVASSHPTKTLRGLMTHFEELPVVPGVGFTLWCLASEVAKQYGEGSTLTVKNHLVQPCERTPDTYILFPVPQKASITLISEARALSGGLTFDIAGSTHAQGASVGILLDATEDTRLFRCATATCKGRQMPVHSRGDPCSSCQRPCTEQALRYKCTVSVHFSIFQCFLFADSCTCTDEQQVTDCAGRLAILRWIRKEGRLFFRSLTVSTPAPEMLPAHVPVFRVDPTRTSTFTHAARAHTVSEEDFFTLATAAPTPKLGVFPITGLRLPHLPARATVIALVRDSCCALTHQRLSFFPPVTNELQLVVGEYESGVIETGFTYTHADERVVMMEFAMMLKLMKFEKPSTTTI